MKLRDEARPSRFRFGGQSCIRPPVIRPPLHVHRCTSYVHQSTAHPVALMSTVQAVDPLPFHQSARLNIGHQSGRGERERVSGTAGRQASQPVALLTSRPPLTMARCLEPLRICWRWSPVHRWQFVHLFACSPLSDLQHLACERSEQNPRRVFQKVLALDSFLDKPTKHRPFSAGVAAAGRDLMSLRG